MRNAQSKAMERGKLHRNIQQLSRKIDKLKRDIDHSPASSPTYNSKLAEHSALVVKRTKLLRQAAKGY